MTDEEKLTIALRMLRAIHHEFRATVREMDNDGKGMQVRFCGDFPPSSLSPGVKGRFRWWHRAMGDALREIGVDPDDE